MLPKVTFEHVQDLAPGFGRAHLSGELLRVDARAPTRPDTYNGVPYVFGYEGTKQHLALEAAWEDQFILPGGVTATPYLGGRLDATSYDRTLGAIGAPYPTQFDNSLLSVTPIAAMDVRWPLVAKNGFDTHLLEPVAQLVYRGSSTTAVGITNDDAQSFVFDTSNLFTYNHFSGIDRQDTGLFANIGGHYLANFADGSWLDLVAGESFHLAGLNALGVTDAAQTGTSTGTGWSGVVSGRQRARRPAERLPGGRQDPGRSERPARDPRRARRQLHVPERRVRPAPATPSSPRTRASARWPTSTRVFGSVSVPVADYWRVNGDLTWNLATNSWIKADTGVTYDDGYLVLGAGANFTTTSWGYGVHFGLKGPDGSLAF